MRSFLRLSLAVAGIATSVMAREAPNPHPASAALEGLWSGASYTELERPDELKTLVVTPEQALAWETRLKPSGGVNVGKDGIGQATSEFSETASVFRKCQKMQRCPRPIRRALRPQG